MSTNTSANVQETDDDRECPTPHEKLTLETLNKKTAAFKDYISRMFKEWTSRMAPEEKVFAKDICNDVFWLIKNYKILQEHSEKRIEHLEKRVEHSEKKIEHLKAAAEVKAEANIRAVKRYLDIFHPSTENNENE
jgi:hypothetical protein